MNALGKIQAALKAPKGQFNSFGKYHYRNCEDILEAVKPLLTEHGATLTISDSIEAVGDRIYVKATVRLFGEKGSMTEVSAYAREAATKKGMDEAQITGAASSYARKYALGGLFCLDDTKDADSQDNRQKDPPRHHSNGTDPETEAVKIRKAIEAAEYPAKVDKVMADSLAIIGTWPQKWQQKINDLANTKRETLGGAAVNQ